MERGIVAAAACMVACSAAQLGWHDEERAASAPPAEAPAAPGVQLVEGVGHHHHPIATNSA